MSKSMNNLLSQPAAEKSYTIVIWKTDLKIGGITMVGQMDFLCVARALKYSPPAPSQ